MTASSSPLTYVNEVAKDFKVTEGKRVHPRQQRAFVESQVQEQQLIINRLLVDAAMARNNRDSVEDETMKAAHQKKVTQFEDELRQFTKTLDFFLELQAELAKAYPEVDSAKAERPDGF